MQGQNIVRVFFFCVFFAIGAAVLSGSVFSDVLLTFYQSRQLLETQKQRTSQLKSLIEDYNALLAEVEKDPNLSDACLPRRDSQDFIKRIAPATLGTKPDDANVIYPKASDELRIAAKKVLAENLKKTSVEPTVPAWLTRCSEPRWRIALFFSGAGLIFISFICFRVKVS